MKPLVSILIPAFNAETFVAETIASALAQTWPRIETIVVDDGSTDRTVEVCQSLASAGVSVLTQSNRGVCAARNRAFSVCRGDYIQWLDADDLLAPDKIARQIEALEAVSDPRVVLSCAWTRFRYRPHRGAFVPSALWADLPPAEWLFRKLGQNVYMSSATWLVSRELTEAVGPWDTQLIVDNDGEYFARVLLASAGVRFVPEARVFARQRAGSLSYIEFSPVKIEAKLDSLEKQIGYLRALEDTERTRAAALAALRRYLPYAYAGHPEMIERARRLAAALGDRLAAPRLSWKYDWIRVLFGWVAAKRAQAVYNGLKLRLLLALDRLLARVDGGKEPGATTRVAPTPAVRASGREHSERIGGGGHE